MKVCVFGKVAYMIGVRNCRSGSAHLFRISIDPLPYRKGIEVDVYGRKRSD